VTNNLLRDIAGDGFPADYLRARVRGRRAALVSDWRSAGARSLPTGTSDESIWERLLQELEWLHWQMNRRLRDCFGPVFMLFELKTLVLCLRNKAVQGGAEIERLLRHSLLAEPLQGAIRQEPDVRATVAAVGTAFAGTVGAAPSLESAYADGGLKGFESRLTRGYLEHLDRARLHPVIGGFFASFIDLRNLMTLYKHLRWGIDDAAAFVPGGTIEASRLRLASTGKDSVCLDVLVKSIAGRAAPPLAASEGALETVLLGSMTQSLRKIGRDSEDVGLILDYVWRVYVQARNQAVLLHAGDLDAATLERELIA